ncbi:MAG TPA: NADH-quinone oxidoreductase subunit M [Gemmatimonadaceae bacterium]|jgi:NADH-quinone oxidoreductase subunit M|nr:NADH-quinone oxidoreductase subunit M [Gemmatimonadaceae bacterium]
MQDLLVSVNFFAWALPALLVVPLVGALLIRLFGRTALPDREPGFAPWREVRNLAFGTLVVELLIALLLWLGFDPAGPAYQAVADFPWIPEWGARLRFGVDGISLAMVLLTAVVMPAAVLGGWTSVTTKIRSYYALLLVLTTGLMGVFLSLDLLLFYVMWELMLVPLYFLIGIWGAARRVRASLKYFLFTFPASLLMLVAIIATYVAAGSQSFDVEYLIANTDMTVLGQAWLFGAFFLAFAVKSALVPMHTWLPDAQHEAPIAAAVALGVKVGAYGLLRFALPLFPAGAMDSTVRTVIIVLSVVTIVYGALVAMVQPDLKRLTSYSSISHVGFVFLGIFALTVTGVQGSVTTMVSSGLATCALFLMLGMLHERRGTGMIANFGGLAKAVPMYATLFTLFVLSSIGLPGTVGFVGEFLVLVGSYATYPLATVVGATGVVLAAAYALWAFQRVFFEPLANPENAKMPDLNRRELGVVGLLAILIIWLGIAPGNMLRRIEPAAERLVQGVTTAAGMAGAQGTPEAP